MLRKALTAERASVVIFGSYWPGEGPLGKGDTLREFFDTNTDFIPLVLSLGFQLYAPGPGVIEANCLGVNRLDLSIRPNSR